MASSAFSLCGVLDLPQESRSLNKNVYPPAAHAVTAKHQYGADGGVACPDPLDDLVRLAEVMDTLGGEIVEADDIGSFAIELAVRGWRVLPLRGKVPAIRGGRGVHDATSDPLVVARWWGGYLHGLQHRRAFRTRCSSSTLTPATAATRV